MTYPNPGVLPTKSAPSPSDVIELRVDGLPSFKELHRSIRNPKHPRHDAFLRLREAAIAAMNGRECYSGPVAMDFCLHAPRLQRRLLGTVAGVEDVIDYAMVSKSFRAHLLDLLWVSQAVGSWLSPLRSSSLRIPSPEHGIQA